MNLGKFGEDIEIIARKADYDSEVHIAVFRRMPGVSDRPRQVLRLTEEWVDCHHGGEIEPTFKVLSKRMYNTDLPKQIGELALAMGWRPANDRIAGELDARREHLTDTIRARDRLLALLEKTP